MKPASEMDDAELKDELAWARLHLQSKRLDQRAMFKERFDELDAETKSRQRKPTG